MLYATNRFPGDGMTTQYEISFVGGYLDRAHVKAYVEGADLVQTPVTISPGNFIGQYTIGGLATVPVGATLVIYRDTPKAPIVDFINGSRFTESNLDTATRQGSFIAAEGADAVSPSGLAGVIQQVVDFSSAAGVARDQAVAAQDAAIAASDSASLSASNANDSAISAAAYAADTSVLVAQAQGFRDTASTHATDAGNSATAADGSAIAASGSATSAASSAGTATTQAGIATTKAAEAAASATSVDTAFLRDRANHIGTQAASTIVGLTDWQANPTGVQSINGGQLAGMRNKIINGNFGINQRAVSGTVTLAAGAYGHDGWKAGASGCTYTFAKSENVTTITISSGSLIQVVDGENLQSGVHILGYNGTAQAKIGAGSYGASGQTYTTTGGTNVNIEFKTGTVLLVQFEPGSVRSAFEHRMNELELCQRYFLAGQRFNAVIYSGSGQGNRLPVAFPTGMRATPTIVFSSISYINGSGVNANNTDTLGFNLSWTATSAGASGVTASYTASAGL